MAVAKATNAAAAHARSRDIIVVMSSAGFRAVLRIPITNIIAIMAGRRALMAYIGTLAGQAITWDKTSHSDHPVRGLPAPMPTVTGVA